MFLGRAEGLANKSSTFLVKSGAYKSVKVDTMGFRCKVLRAGGGRAVSVWALASLGPVVCDVTWKPWQWQGAEALLADLRRGKVCCLSILWERCVDLPSTKGHRPFFK